MKINIVLFQPEIPQNTGNISRTCSATGCALHLVHPLGFSLDERHLRRAGLDYWDGLEIYEYPDNNAFFSAHTPEKMWFFSQKGTHNYWDIPSEELFSDKEIWLVFGRESRGLD
ncbi:MAG: tRNA (uridine(34)/cytosine(34)/5-carboxymethylaminomethyluridine(34)-2'-O)-methyltransferase TrmL, partial [Spirochaetales bacterium]|nr:tRNA (uridine(34)/cytosine(34)/5-carboxymethylaminomethyluridine(34)-2'-O)-methyltransferase TrmL [Spirochaetales bacterium]